ncbi:hypothetical protein EJ02DRAFT_415320, partial [Clathrospora elynae]
MISFPFVVVEADALKLRQQQPFLFHAIMTATTGTTPHIQCVLGDEFKRQIAYSIEHSKKSLEVLQGLLVYGAWYTAFYRPATQQIAIIVQLCVALVQDLEFSSNQKKRVRPAAMKQYEQAVPSDPLAGKRAFLGTYFLAVTFAQAWRKRTTLSYTRYMGQCCESFVNSSMITDKFIPPMIQSCELISRVNDHFSYDDIENSEVNGELMLEMSTSNFRKELKRIRDSAARSTEVLQNTTLTLMFSLADTWIDECCLHSSLWHTSTHSDTSQSSLIRLRMLHRTMASATSYLKTLLQLPKAQLFHLGLQTWSSCFHVVIIICKLVFLEDNERLGHTPFDGIQEELENLRHLGVETRVSRIDINKPSGYIQEGSWYPMAVTRQYSVQELFDSFTDMLRFTLPLGCGPWTIPREKRDSLHSIASIHHLMQHGFTKRIQRFKPS